MSRDEAGNAPDALELIAKRVSVVLFDVNYLPLLSLLAPPASRGDEFAAEERVEHLPTWFEEGTSEGGGREGGRRGGGGRGRGGGGVLQEADKYFQVVVQGLLVGQGVLS